MNPENSRLPPGMDTGLTTRQVMAMLNVKKPDTIYALCRSGKITGQQMGRAWRFSRLSVEAFLAGKNPAARAPQFPPRPSVAMLPAVPMHFRRF